MGCGASLPTAAEHLKEFSPQTEYSPYETLTSTEVVDLIVKQKLFSLSGGDFVVKDTTGKEYCKVKGKVMSMRDRIVIEGMNGEPIACILEKVFSMSPAMFIYGFKPYYEGQQPTKETQNDKPLYAWAKVWQTAMAMTQIYNINMASGDDSYTDTAKPDYYAKAPSMTAPRLSVWKGASDAGEGCGLIDRPTVDWDWANSYKISVAKGIDPVLLLGLTICKDKIQEKQQ